MIELIDSHAHLSSTNFSDLSSVLLRAKKANISQIINVCTDKASLEESLALEKKFSIYSAAATTPHDVEEKEDSFFPFVEKYGKEKKLVAIGETGLDYHYGLLKKELQKAYFIKYIELAKELSLPLIIHCREAFPDLFELTRPYLPLKAVLHCFTGTEAEADSVLKNGWFISISGIVTFKNSPLQKIVKNLPLEKLLIETDSPLLAPQKYRGKTNEPAFLVETALAISAIKELSFEDLARAISLNARDFFNLPLI